MKTLTYSITIDKPIADVFAAVTDCSLFPQWAKAWGEGMTCAGEWRAGANIVFTDPSGSGTKVIIEELITNELIKMKHIAMVEDGDQEVAQVDETMKKWIGSREDYFFTADTAEQTTFKVVCITDEAFEEMMGAWPQALQYLKEMCEAS